MGGRCLCVGCSLNGREANIRSIRIALLAWLWTCGLSAQEADTPRRRLSISGTIGGVLGGPASSAAGSLESTGWGDTSPGHCVLFFLCVDASAYPKTEPGTTWELTIRYEVTRRWAVSAGTTVGLSLGNACGYRDGPPDLFNVPGDHLDSSYEGSSHGSRGRSNPPGR
jgi:hypothetical protein